MHFLYRPIALLSVISLVMASVLTGLPASADTNDSSHIPAGQLTRRGLTGTVVGVGGSSFVLETKFGNVTIDVNDGTIVKSGGEIVGFEVLSTGDRVGVLLDRPPDVSSVKSDGDDGPDLTPPSGGDDTGTEPDVTPTATPDLTPPPDSDDSGTEPEVTPTPTPDLTPPTDGDDSGTEPDVTPTPTPTATPTQTPTPTPTATPDLTPLDTSDDTGTEPDPTPTPTPTATPDLTPPPGGDDSDTDLDLSLPSTSDDSGTEPEPSVTPVPTPAPSFRQGVTALRITIVPSKASRSHQRGVVTSNGQGKIRFLDENGEEQELDGDDDAAEGDDVVFITRGKKGGGASITGSTDPGDVDDRLARFAESHPELAVKITQKKTDAKARRDERLATTLGNAPDDKKGHVQGAIDRKNNRGRGDSDDSGKGNSGGGNSGNSGQSGPGNTAGNAEGDKPGDKGDKGGSGRGSSGGGDSGNSGGKGRK